MALSMSQAAKMAEKMGEVVKGNAFTGVMRDFDFNGLVVGDEFIVPKEYEVRVQNMGKNRNGDPILAEYIFVETQTGTKKFFPGMFSKNVLVYEKTEAGQPLRTVKDENGTVVTKHVHGTAVDLFRSEMPDVNAGMQKLANSGKKVKIVSSEKVLTRAFSREALTESSVYQIDLV